MRLAELSREELAVLALTAGVAGESRVFSRKQDMRRLSKLAFLAAYGDKGDDGSIRLRDKPRLRLRFHVYLYGVTSRDIYDVIRSLEEKGVIERVDVDVYRINVSAEEVLEAVKRYGDLHDGVMLALSYKDMTGDELEGFVNGMLGLGGPALKAMVYGIDVQKLLEARKAVREMEEKGLIVDV